MRLPLAMMAILVSGCGSSDASPPPPNDNAGGAGQGGAPAGPAGKGGSAGTPAAGKGGSAGKSGASGGAGKGAAAGSAGSGGASAGAAGKGGAAGKAGSGVGGAAGANAGAAGANAGAAGANAGAAGAGSTPTVILPKSSLDASELAVLVNTDDPQSVAVGEHYRVARGVPSAHVIKLALGAGLGTTISESVFSGWKAKIDAAVDGSIQAYAVTWTSPSVVDCMSLTSALAFGFDKKWCNTQGGCGTTAQSPYFDSASATPFTTHMVRPAMVLPGVSADKAIALIDRGVSADGTFPVGDGWLLRTSDSARSVRYPQFMQEIAAWNHPEGLQLTYLDSSAGGTDFISGKNDVLFYLTGLADVPMITTNTYRPGAVADHLTSYGGQIPNSGQMSILRWIEAGATASFGTVVEPCNFTTKFPDATVLLPHYYRGETVLEAYWKSVAWPGEGLFVGEPLARPWGTKTSFAGGTLTLMTTTLVPGASYAIESAPAAAGPWAQVQSGITIAYHQPKTLTVANATAAFYRLVKM